MEQAAVLALAKASPREWWRTAALIHEAGSATALLNRCSRPMVDELQQYAEELVPRVRMEDVAAAEQLVDSVAEQGIRLLTVLDHDYPVNLQLVYNRPPFIFVKGELRSDDSRAIAVVGTRQASETGLTRAALLARGLAEQGVTVVSGLARGIDTAAHTAALNTPAGRTVAVIGNGILTPLYPKENRPLGDRIGQQGAVISQFWPDAPPRQVNFPMRNAVMSGVAMGTVVVEASATSGAKMQARLALEHGKRLFLLESLVTSQDWARRYVQRPGVSIVKNIDDILETLVKLANAPEQLMLQL